MATRVTRRVGGRAADGGVGFRLHELGDDAGPRIVVLGGVHGDESQGVRSAMKVAAAAFRADLAGTLLVVPVAHEAAFLAASRVNPADRGNLARAFPGSPGGTPTERLAHLLEQEVLCGADLVIDLHSSGVHYTTAVLAGFPDDGGPGSQRALRGAAAMALPVTWRHPGPMPPGRTGSASFARGVPFLYTESPESEDRSDDYAAAVLRLLALEGMIDPALAPRPIETPLRLAGPGDLDTATIVAPRDGLVEICVGPLERVEAGQPVARWTDPWFSRSEDLLATEPGVVVVARRSRSVAAGDMLVHLAKDDAAA
ncbi:MAG: succinylglutamate desuccinylase/aspartoacylase family protein [Chloroflexota bacterium]